MPEGLDGVEVEDTYNAEQKEAALRLLPLYEELKTAQKAVDKANAWVQRPLRRYSWTKPEKFAEIKQQAVDKATEQLNEVRGRIKSAVDAAKAKGVEDPVAAAAKIDTKLNADSVKALGFRHKMDEAATAAPVIAEVVEPEAPAEDALDAATPAGPVAGIEEINPATAPASPPPSEPPAGGGGEPPTDDGSIPPFSPEPPLFDDAQGRGPVGETPVPPITPPSEPPLVDGAVGSGPVPPVPPETPAEKPADDEMTPDEAAAENFKNSGAGVEWPDDATTGPKKPLVPPPPPPKGPEGPIEPPKPEDPGAPKKPSLVSELLKGEEGKGLDIDKPTTPEVEDKSKKEADEAASRLEKAREKLPEASKKLVDLALETKAREDARVERRYGKQTSLWNRIKKGLNESWGGRLVGGALKTGQGIAEVVASGLLAGPSGMLLSPALFAHGTMQGIEGALQMISSFGEIGGDRKVATANKEIDKLTDQLKKEIVKGAAGNEKIKELATQIRIAEADKLAAQSGKMSLRAKMNVYGLVGGALGSTASVLVGGLPTGFQNFGGAQFLSAGHQTAFDLTKGWMFGYKGGEAAVATAHGAQTSTVGLGGAVGHGMGATALGTKFLLGGGLAIAAGAMFLQARHDMKSVENLKAEAEALKKEAAEVNGDPVGDVARKEAEDKAKAEKDAADKKAAEDKTKEDKSKGIAKDEKTSDGTGDGGSKKKNKAEEKAEAKSAEEKAKEDEEKAKAEKVAANKKAAEEKLKEEAVKFVAEVGKDYDFSSLRKVSGGYETRLNNQDVLLKFAGEEKDWPKDGESVRAKVKGIIDRRPSENRGIGYLELKVELTTPSSENLDEEVAKKPLDQKAEKALRAAEKAFEKGSPWKIRRGAENNRPLRELDPNAEYHIDGFEINQPEIDNDNELEGAKRLYVKLSEPDKSGEPISIEANYLVSHFDSSVIGNRAENIAAIGGVLNKKFKTLLAAETPADTEPPKDDVPLEEAPPEEPVFETPFGLKPGDLILQKADGKVFEYDGYNEIFNSVNIHEQGMPMNPDTFPRDTFQEEFEPYKAPEVKEVEDSTGKISIEVGGKTLEIGPGTKAVFNKLNILTGKPEIQNKVVSSAKEIEEGGVAKYLIELNDGSEPIKAPRELFIESVEKKAFNFS